MIPGSTPPPPLYPMAPRPRPPVSHPRLLLVTLGRRTSSARPLSPRAPDRTSTSWRLTRRSSKGAAAVLFGRPGKAAGHCAGGRATPEPTTRRPWSGQNPFAIDGLRVSSRVAGGGGPRDRAHGGGAFGAVERVHSRWRWTFQDVGPSVVGGWRYAGAAATAKLMAAQSLLFPSDLPTEDWFDPKRRAAHPRRVKISARGRQARAAPAIRQRGPHLHSRLAFPRDARAPSNDFLGFYNLRNARYSSAVLRCIFQYEPLVFDPPPPCAAPGRRRGQAAGALRRARRAVRFHDGCPWAP